MHASTPPVIRYVVTDDVERAFNGMGALRWCHASPHTPKDHRILADTEWEVCRNLTCERFSQQPRLQLQTALVTGAIAKIWVLQFLLEPLFKLGVKRFARLCFEMHDAQFFLKVFLGQNAMVHDI